MSTSFPTSLDSYTTKATDETIATGHINDPQDAIEALEAKVGVDSSAVTTSHDYKLSNVTSTNKAVSATRSINTTSPVTGGGDLSADRTIAVSAASDTAAGVVELATVAETDTGTDATRAVTPDGLAGSNFGERAIQAYVVEATTDVATGDGKFYFHIDSRLGGMNLVDVHAEVITAGTTGTTDIQIANVTQAVDMLTTKITIDSGETGSDTAATAAVIDTANDDVAENDVIRIDCDAVSTTPAKGLIVTLGFKLP